MQDELRILILEDRPEDAELLERELGRGGLAIRPCRVETRDDFEAMLQRFEWDLILSDYSLPRFDGLSALELARRLAPDAPFIFVSGTIGEDRAIESLKLGATDYIVKDRLARLGPAVRRALDEVAERRRRREAEERARRSALYDPLTELPNRVLFMDRLEQSLRRAARTGAEAPAVLLLDLDRFKNVNDGFGHAAGDTLLAAVARRLEPCLQPDDTLARIGGDEFGAVLEDSGSAERATAAAARICSELARPFALDAAELYVSASVGVAIASEGTAESVLRSAEAAMYRAKSRGKARYEVFEPGAPARGARQLQLEVDLRRALERSELELHYQPILSLRSGRISGCEALLRWRHPERGMVSPGEFIPAAEESGLILPIGEWALYEAARQSRAWQDAGAAPGWTAVNVSAWQFRNTDVRATVLDVLERTGLDPARLKIELTESAVMDDVTRAVRALSDLRELGVHLSMDDFGTGYSSLSYLRRFPFSTVKIDRSFVMELPHDPDSVAIAEAILTLARSLKRSVVAEGVETREQLDFLVSRGCDEMQGYLFSPAVPADRFEAMLRSGKSLPIGPGDAA
jgi:diguanylate cyclase